MIADLEGPLPGERLSDDLAQVVEAGPPRAVFESPKHARTRAFLSKVL